MSATKNRLRTGSNWCVYANDDRVFALRVAVKAGAVHEPPRMCGASHLLEHLLFKKKSTKKTKRPRDEIADMGATVNASTGKDYTVYEIAVPAVSYAKAIDTMRRIVFCLEVDAKQLEREKDIVLQEKQETSDDIEETFVRCSFAGTAYEKSVIGTDASIRGIQLRHLRAYHRERYLNGGCVACATCPPDAIALVAESLERAFGAFGPPCADPRHDVLAGVTKVTAKKSRLICYSDPEDRGREVGCRVAFQSSPYDRRKKAITGFVLDYLSGRIETGWYCHLRERKGYVYSLNMHSTYTFACGGIVSLCMVSGVDTLRVLREWGCLLVDVLNNGVFRRNNERFRTAKSSYVARQKVHAYMNVHDALERVTEDALYSTQDEPGGVYFCQAHEQTKMVETAELEEVEEVAFAFLSSPVLFMLGNSNTELSPQKFEDRARKTVSAMLRRFPAPSSSSSHPLSSSLQPSLDTYVTDID